MKRHLGILALTCVLAAGCGSGTGAAEDDVPPAAASSRPSSTGAPTSPSPPSDDPVTGDYTVIGVVAAPAAGGASTTTPVLLDSRRAIRAYADTFARPGVAALISAELAKASVPAGQVPVAAVLSIGCDVPSGVGVDLSAGLVLLPEGLAKTTPECLVATTAIGLVAAAPALLGGLRTASAS